MKKVFIDTNIYTHFKNNCHEVIDRLRLFDYIAISNIVLGELLCGFKLGTKEHHNMNDLERFLDTPRAYVINTDETTAEFYANIYAQLRRKGTPIPTNDMWIAALAMQHGLGLYSIDKHFTNIDGLILV